MAKKEKPSSRQSTPSYVTRTEPLPIRWPIDPGEVGDPRMVERALRERIKELNCLYGIARLGERNPSSLDKLLAGVVEILPVSWQFPEVTCARVVFRGHAYTSRGFRVTRWRQSAQVFVYKEPVGEVEVFYLEECPPAQEGPFLREERSLLDAVAEHIGMNAMRIMAEQELQEANRQLMVERQALQESNTALRTILAKIEDEKLEIKKDIQANIEKVLMPILNALAIETPKSQARYVEILRDNLDDIASPFINKLSHAYQSLTPTEISICDLIRGGLQTKEIASMRGVSPATICRHREHIRSKLGIANQRINLVTYLQTLS